MYLNGGFESHSDPLLINNNMRLQELILEDNDDSVIDAGDRFGTGAKKLAKQDAPADPHAKFNKDTPKHDMIKRHIQIDFADLSDAPISVSNRAEFSIYFEDKFLHIINAGINDVPLRNIDWVEIDGVLFSSNLDNMEIIFTVRSPDPDNMIWFHDIVRYLRKEARVAMGMVLRGRT